VQYATDKQEQRLLEQMSVDEVLYSTWCQSQSVRQVIQLGLMRSCVSERFASHLAIVIVLV